MKCPHCGKDVTESAPQPEAGWGSLVKIDGQAVRVVEAKPLPFHRKTSVKFYKQRAADVERPVLVLVEAA